MQLTLGFLFDLLQIKQGYKIMRINSFRAIITSIFCGFMSISIMGCAGSNASYAASNQARTLTMKETKNAGSDLVNDIVKAPRFDAFVKKMKQANRETVVLLQDYTNNSEDPSWSGKSGKLRNMFLQIEEQFVAAGITFKQDLDPGLPNYVPGIEQFDKQDSDDRYDQQNTGDVTTGAASKAVLGLILEFAKETNPENGSTLNEFSLTARIVDGKSKTTLVVKSVPIEKRN